MLCSTLAGGHLLNTQAVCVGLKRTLAVSVVSIGKELWNYILPT